MNNKKKLNIITLNHKIFATIIVIKTTKARKKIPVILSKNFNSIQLNKYNFKKKNNKMYLIIKLRQFSYNFLPYHA